MDKAAISDSQGQVSGLCAGNKARKLQARPMLSPSGNARAARSGHQVKDVSSYRRVKGSSPQNSNSRKDDGAQQIASAVTV
jgi:hypothetical protein